MDFLDTAFKIQIWPAETMSEALVILAAIALVIFVATAVLRIWWLLSTWELRRRKLRLEVEKEGLQTKESALAKVRRGASRRSNGKGEQATPISSHDTN